MSLTKENGLNFLRNMEGYHEALKMIHWSTDNKAEHLLTDEIDSDILEYEDRIAENIMGNLKIRYGVGDLKAFLPEATTLESILDELEDDVVDFKDEIDGNSKMGGLFNILDDFLESINKWKYLQTLK